MKDDVICRFCLVHYIYILIFIYLEGDVEESLHLLVHFWNDCNG